MADREQTIKELMEGFQSLRRFLASRPHAAPHVARMTPSQWGVLLCLEKRGEITVKDVSETLGISSSAATQLVDALVAKKYLVRKASAHDRRQRPLGLSPFAKKKLTRMKADYLKQLVPVFAVLTDAELTKYLALNKKITRALLST